jgi:ankyrin repeat protein
MVYYADNDYDYDEYNSGTYNACGYNHYNIEPVGFIGPPAPRHPKSMLLMCAESASNLKDEMGYEIDINDIEVNPICKELVGMYRASGKNWQNVLLTAAEKGHIDIVDLMVKNGVYTTTGERSDALGGTVDTIHFPETRPFKTRSALHVASANGQLEVVQYLIENKIDVPQEVLMHEAVKSLDGGLDVIKYLIEKGVGSQRHVRGRRPPPSIFPDVALSAAASGNLQVVQYFLENNLAQPNSELLQMAASKGSLELVHYLLTKNITIDDMDDNVINNAARGGHLHIVRYLVERNLEMPTNNTLVFAASNGHLNVLKYLIEMGIGDVDDVAYHTALINAASNGHLNVVRFIIERDLVTTEAKESLEWAAMNGRVDVVMYLLDNGFELETVPFEVIENGDLEMAWVLYDAGTNFVLEDLNSSIRFGYLDMVKFLVETVGIDVNNNNGRPLLLAVRYDNYEIVKYLVEEGGALIGPEHLGATIAHQKGYTEIAEYLVSRGGVIIPNYEDEDDDDVEGDIGDGPPGGGFDLANFDFGFGVGGGFGPGGHGGFGGDEDDDEFEEDE